MTYQNILVEAKEGIGTLTINRPKALNALNVDTLNEIIRGINELEIDKSVDVIIITGAGDKAFIAGADIAAMKEMGKSDAENFVHIGHHTMKSLRECEKPVIAMVNGYALGGGTEMVLACDFVYASENAKFGLPEVSLGIFPGFGGTQRLPRHIGEQRAKELIFSGKTITAQEAYDWGIVNKVVPQERLLEETLSIAGAICKKGQVAVRLAKRAINKGLCQTLSHAMETERDIFVECFNTNDRKEGMTAFLEKRKPSFAGK